MDYSRFNFISTYPSDMIVYFYNGTISLPAWANDMGTGAVTTTIAHGSSTQFFPTIRYSWDSGVTWYSDGETSPYWYSAASEYIEDVAMTVKSNDTNIVITSTSGSVARSNIIYEVYGIKKNV